MKKIYLCMALISAVSFAEPLNVANENLPFEGEWRTGFGANRIDENDDSLDQRAKFANQDGYILFQKGDNVCGTWSYVANGLYEGLLYGRKVSNTQVKVLKRCGQLNGVTAIDCWQADKEYGQNNNFLSNITSWDNSVDRDLINITDKGFMNARHVEQAGKKILSQQAKDKFLLENAWLNECLDYNGE